MCGKIADYFKRLVLFWRGLSGHAKAKLLLVVVLFVGSTAAIVWATGAGYTEDFLRLVRDLGWKGNLITIGMLFIAGLIAVPLSMVYTLLYMGAGFMYGFWFGMLTILAGADAALPVSIIIYRTAGREWLLSSLTKQPRLRVVIEALRSKGIKSILLLRLLPIPAGCQNAICSLSRLPLWQSTLASIAGYLPEQAILVGMGTRLGDVKELVEGKKNSTWDYVTLALEVSALLVALVAVGRVAQKALREYEADEALGSMGESLCVYSSGPAGGAAAGGGGGGPVGAGKDGVDEEGGTMRPRGEGDDSPSFEKRTPTQPTQPVTSPPIAVEMKEIRRVSPVVGAVAVADTRPVEEEEEEGEGEGEGDGTAGGGEAEELGRELRTHRPSVSDVGGRRVSLSIDGSVSDDIVARNF